MNPPKGSKPFILTAALAGAPVVFRNGNPVSRITVDSDNRSNYPLLAYAYTEPTASCHMLDGQYFAPHVTDLDLFMAPEPKKTKKVWINLYGTSKKVQAGDATWDNEEQARAGQIYRLYQDDALPYLTTVEVEVPA